LALVFIRQREDSLRSQYQLESHKVVDTQSKKKKEDRRGEEKYVYVHCKMSSRVSIRLVGFVAIIRLSLTVWQGKRLNSSCLQGQTVKLSHITATKPTSQLNKSTRLAKMFQQFGFSTLSHQTNRQVKWILD